MPPQVIKKIRAIRLVKREAVLAVLESFDPGHTFSISESERVCPTVSRATIRRVLGDLREKGQVKCLGTGWWARWRGMVCVA